MTKEDLLNRIKEDIKALNEMDEGNTGTYLVHGDITTGKTAGFAFGDNKCISIGMGNQMRLRPEFKGLTLALVGAFLANHQDEKDQFIDLLESTPQAPMLS